MNINVHRSEDRGSADHGWLKTKHCFSFANYWNPDRVKFGKLRVLNEDRIAPGKGFSKHPHEDMEIVTIVLNGVLEHEDSEGNIGQIKPGEIQKMSAGTGVLHSERNASDEEELHILQIWIIPKEEGIEPSYEEIDYSRKDIRNKLYPIASPYDDNSVYIHQDCTFLLGEMDEGKKIEYNGEFENSGFYLFVIDGKINLGQHELKEGDSAEITESDSFEFKAVEDSKVLLIETVMD